MISLLTRAQDRSRRFSVAVQEVWRCFYTSQSDPDKENKNKKNKEKCVRNEKSASRDRKTDH